MWAIHPAFLREALRWEKNILLEGQLGALKDPDYGIYPMVTSSSTLAGYGAVGAGLPPYAIEDILVVVKAYSSAVGAGAFVSEIFGDEAQEMRIRGGDAGGVRCHHRPSPADGMVRLRGIPLRRGDTGGYQGGF